MAKAKNTTNTQTIYSINLDMIVPDMTNARVYYEDDMYELRLSIKQVGLIQPISVQKNTDGDYGIICGHRRYYACKMLGMEQIPCIVFTDLSKNDIKLMQLTENIQRADIHPLDEAEAIKSLRRLGLTYKEISDKLGKTVNYVTKRQALNDLIEPLKARFRKGDFDVPTALKIALMPEVWQKSNADRNNWNYMGIQFKHLDEVRFDKTECQTCQFNSACNSLFEVDDAVCYNEQCFDQKTFIADIALLDEAMKKYQYFISTTYTSNKHEQRLTLAGKTVLTRDLYELLDDEPTEPKREDYEDNQEYLSELEDYKRDLKEYTNSKKLAVPSFVYNGYDAFTEKYILLSTMDETTVADDITNEARLNILKANLKQAKNEKDAYHETKLINFQASLDKLFEDKIEAMQSVEFSERLPEFSALAFEFFKRKLMEDFGPDDIKPLNIQQCVNLWVISEIADRYVDMESYDIMEQMAIIINPSAHYEKKKQLALEMIDRIMVYDEKIKLLQSKIDNFVNNSEE